MHSVVERKKKRDFSGRGLKAAGIDGWYDVDAAASSTRSESCSFYPVTLSRVSRRGFLHGTQNTRRAPDIKPNPPLVVLKNSPSKINFHNPVTCVARALTVRVFIFSMISSVVADMATTPRRETALGRVKDARRALEGAAYAT